MHINKVLFTGFLVRDPDLRKAGPTRVFPEGVPVCNITLAQNSRVRDGDRWVDGDPIFVDVALWGKRAESFAAHHKKGDEAYIEGKLRYDTWEDKERPGQKRTKLKVDADEWQFVPRGERKPNETGGASGGDDTPF